MVDFSRSKNSSVSRATSWFWLVGSLVGGSLLSAQFAGAAWARPLLNDTSHFLLAQQVMDGLPPPPPGSQMSGSQVQAQTYPAQAQTYPAPQSQQYMVVVNGNSQILLTQVQAVQPSASVQDYNGQQFIQAGLFNDLNMAQQQVTSLAASGIEAQVMAVVPTTVSQTDPSVAVPTTPSYGSPETQPYGTGTLPPPEPMPNVTVPSAPAEVQFGAPDSQVETQREPSGRSYYVVIPGKADNLTAVSEQITRLTSGMGIDGMVSTSSSRGSHIRVGPFESRGAANRWTRYFRDFGMDARVGYGR